MFPLVTFFATAGDVNRTIRVPWRPPGGSGLVVHEERQRRLGLFDHIQMDMKLVRND